jgi:hypothetical protein
MNGSNKKNVDFLRSTNLTQPNQNKSINDINILKYVILVTAVMVITCPISQKS